MRRPAHHRPTAWAHPYTGVAGLAVFYNSGGDPEPQPTPAPAPKPTPPPAAPAPAREFTQEDLDRIAAREKAQGKRSALKEFAEEQGFSSAEDAAAFIAAARQAQQAALSEEDKRRQELDRREQELAAKEAAAVARERAAVRRAALMKLGALGDDLEDALALLDRDLHDQPDADEATVTTAAEAIKARRAALFGADPAATRTPAPVLPPAPAGAPAGGPPRTPAVKDDIKARALERARKMGYAKPDAAA
ncbi:MULTISPECIES: hypothetical protein [Streptomyces]|uniref:hypothetical protein n=1 Tax=Streptomyces TaxID=1883 RepID=UPI000568F517|nr:hypothetical protein [Streptomyces sp. NRRL WC-3719]